MNSEGRERRMPTYNYPTLQDLRKRKYKTIKAFAEAYGCSPTKASGILRGLYHMALSKDDVKYLASVLGVSFLACAEACDNTFAALKNYKGDDWKKTARTHKGIFFGPLLQQEVFARLGVSANASEAEIMKAFRDKVKLASDGKGGYQGDMDKLVQDKEQALKLVRKQ
jgi:transcriptional regulator with XRE-family HTH domain